MSKYNIEPLEKARKLKRLSFTEVAAKVDLGEDMVRKIFRGTRNPSEKSIFRMSEVLEVPMERILIEPKKGRRTA